MEIIRIAFTGIVTALFYVLLRQIKPEIAPLIAIGGVSVLIVVVSESLLGLTSEASEMLGLAGVGKENVSILIKSLGICLVTQFAANICYDNSCSSLASAVELAGKVGALMLAMPMLKAVANLAIGLLNM